jgi:hypothetical protein
MRQPCQYYITYTIYRGTTDTVEPSVKNLLARDVFATSYVAHEVPGKDYGYVVQAFRHPSECTAPSLRSGKVTTFPLDFNASYDATIGGTPATCKATSNSELSCPGIGSFHASVVAQYGHEFLIGCLTENYEYGDWSCVNLGMGVFTIIRHSETLTVLGAGFSKINTKTGKTLSQITPVYSNLGLIK